MEGVRGPGEVGLDERPDLVTAAGRAELEVHAARPRRDVGPLGLAAYADGADRNRVGEEAIVGSQRANVVASGVVPTTAYPAACLDNSPVGAGVKGASLALTGWDQRDMLRGDLRSNDGADPPTGRGCESTALTADTEKGNRTC